MNGLRGLKNDNNNYGKGTFEPSIRSGELKQQQKNGELNLTKFV